MQDRVRYVGRIYKVGVRILLQQIGQRIWGSSVVGRVLIRASADQADEKWDCDHGVDLQPGAVAVNAGQPGKWVGGHEVGLQPYLSVT